MVDMGDDGEIADVSEVSHAEAYDLDSGFGQAGMIDIETSHLRTLPKERAEAGFRCAVAREVLRQLPYLPDAFASAKLGWHYFTQTDLMRLVHHIVCETELQTGELNGQINSASQKFGNQMLTSDEEGMQDIVQLLRILSPIAKLSRPIPETLYELYWRKHSSAWSGSEIERRGDLRADTRQLAGLSYDRPLFESLPNKFVDAMLFNMQADKWLNSYWHEWYQGFLDGKPLDWELQRRVALIEDAIWNAGPEAVAAEIERIRAEFNAPPSGKERFPKHEPSSVSHLFENRVIATASLQGLAAQVTQSIERFHAETGANALPETLEPLSALPALLLAVNSTLQDAPSDGAIASETEDQLQAEIGRLNAKVAQLENELQKASAAKPSVFSDAFKKQLGTSLGDWKLYAALCTGLWFVSGDAEGTQRRLENISHYRDMIFGEVSSPSDAAPARSTAAVESTLEI
ncbi:hypothetical protein KUW17_08920 [Leisingera aquaemixtae]|uniref:hypothetical protein n=1 Tax=Leisingera aquaemixtae TaxID=1396826 RepID=UPI001C98619E|nr:hypothetical protein [Leisingera aquaemixtae]MBY6066861.1 hypothetical protein [Leisingera aquaemixtae]